MKTMPVSLTTANPQPVLITKLSLHRLVSKVMNSLLPVYVQRFNLVLNDIPKKSEITGNEELLTFILEKIISSKITSTSNECIHLECIPSEEFTVIRIKGHGPSDYHTISHKYHEVQSMAARLNGSNLPSYYKTNKPGVAIAA